MSGAQCPDPCVTLLQLVRAFALEAPEEERQKCLEV